MKSVKAIITLVAVVIFVSIAAGYIAGFFVYKEYRERTAYLEEQVSNKFNSLEEDVKELYISLGNRVDKNRIEMREILSKADSIKEGIEDWKRKYKTSISELRRSIDDLKVDRLTKMVENLQAELNEYKIKLQDLELKDEAQGVDLGKISVEK